MRLCTCYVLGTDHLRCLAVLRPHLVLQEKHVETAKLLLGGGKELNSFVSQLLDDIANLKAMLHAISIGAHPHAYPSPCPPCETLTFDTYSSQARQ